MTDAELIEKYRCKGYGAGIADEMGRILSLAELALVYEPVVRAAVRYDGDPGDIMLEREVDRAVAAIPADVRERLMKEKK